MKLLFTSIFSTLSLILLFGCNGGSNTSNTTSTQAIEAPEITELIGTEIAFNPVIRFTTSNECVYDNTLATETTFPQPSDGAIIASYTAVKSGTTLSINITSDDLSFGEDLVLVMSNWSDLDGDYLIDQFSIVPTLGDDSSLAVLTGQFTVNAPAITNSNLNTANLPIFIGGDANRSPTLTEWNNYVVGKQLVFLYLDGNITTLSVSSASSYTTTDSTGSSITGTYDYDMISDTQGRLSLYEKSASTTYDFVQDGYGNAVAAYESEKITTTTERTVIIDLNFFNTSQIYDSTYETLNDKAGGLGIHFLRSKDITIETIGTVSETSVETLSGSTEGSLRLYNDSSLLN